MGPDMPDLADHQSGSTKCCKVTSLLLDPEGAELPEEPSATQPGEDPVNADDVEDSPAPEDLPTENQDEDPTDLIEDTLATDADSLSDIPDEDPLMPAKQDIDDAYITHNSAQGPTPEQERQPPPKTKYSMRTKTSPPSRLMFVSSRTSCPRGGRDVKPSKN